MNKLLFGSVAVVALIAVDLEKNSGIYQGDPNTGGFSGRFDVNDTMWIVRAGVNYKFGG